MSQPERDVLKVMHQVLAGNLRQSEVARLLRLSVRRVRRIQRRTAVQGDQAVVHRLRGQPSNHRINPAYRQKILRV
ncbi:MAG TPA: helix-turn-helix domain-containing protein [Gemmataceae bacterium]